MKLTAYSCCNKVHPMHKQYLLGKLQLKIRTRGQDGFAASGSGTAVGNAKTRVAFLPVALHV